jgi:hypothetical protein
MNAALRAFTSLLILSGATDALALEVNGTSEPAALTGALVPRPGNFGSITATYAQGNSAQVGVYTGFDSPPVTIGGGVVLSTGNVLDVVGPYNNIRLNGEVSTPFLNESTPEIDAYSPGKIANWESSHDAAVVRVDFRLTQPSAVKFHFVFGSVEYPVYTSDFTDAFMAFLDGSQIAFDATGDPVQVGLSFASSLRTDDTNTIFTGVGRLPSHDAHGLLDVLTTTSAELASGDHVMLFAIADVNDYSLDSAVFINGFDVASNAGGPVTQPIPEPSAYVLMAVGVAVVGTMYRRRARLGNARLT